MSEVILTTEQEIRENDGVVRDDFSTKNFASTRNACKLCAPLGASFAFRGIEGCIPLIHGSQGCSTYIRRYGISHFREPIDIASSNFTESSAIFGGGGNLKSALENVTRQYTPKAIGITSTCLSETIGENIPMYLSQYKNEQTAKGYADDSETGPVIMYASTPSYKGTHMDGFHEAVRAAVVALVKDSKTTKNGSINLISNFVSTEDLREMHDILSSFGSPYTLLPDYSESLDGVSWDIYRKLPEGGTPIESIKKMGGANGTVFMSTSVPLEKNAGKYLEDHFGVPLECVPIPIGIENTDVFFAALSKFSGKPVPEKWIRTRGRLVDAYIDGHKYCSGKKAIVYGEEDFVISLCSFLDEIGIQPAIAATGAANEKFKGRLRAVLKNCTEEPLIADDADFATIVELAKDRHADFVLGNSKGLYIARHLNLPLVRCGFPIHDRVGGSRILHIGYKGTLNLFDLICNSVMETKQTAAKSGYTYI